MKLIFPGFIKIVLCLFIFTLVCLCKKVSASSIGDYPDTSTYLGGNIKVSPIDAPVGEPFLNVIASNGFLGILTVDPITGIVSITDANPIGTYTITVSTSLSSSQAFLLTVNNYNPSCGQFGYGSPTNSTTNARPRSVAVGDFDGDGFQDLANCSETTNTVSIRKGNGSGGFSFFSMVTVGTSPFSIAIGDFNKDGKQDLSVANSSSNNVSILIGNGLGGFNLLGNVSTGNSPYFVIVGDFNNDKNQDLATANFNGNNISILLGNGLGGFSSPTNFSVSTNPTSLATGDFNNDGKLDLAVTNFGSTIVSILLGNGLGGFVSNGTVPVGSGPYSIEMQDFNGDGKLDMAVANFTSNTVSVRLGNGLGGFTGSTNLSSGSGTCFVSIRDFDSDGISDIVATNLNANTLTFYTGNGSGGFSLNSTVSTGSGPIMITSGDFNGDHRSDFVVANLNSNQLLFFIRSGSEIDLVANNNTIPDGNTSISADINTDFGPGSTCDFISKNYAIQNPGFSPLTVNNINSSGINASDFVISGISLPLTLAPNQSATFIVTFIPSSVGIKTASIHINNNDCEESDYDFAVQGIGISNSPTLGSYPDTVTNEGDNLTIIPSATPAGISKLDVSASGNFGGILTVDPITGNVMITDSKPAGVYSISVSAGTCITNIFILTVKSSNCNQSVYTSPLILADIPQPRSIAIGEFNGDGFQDLAICSETGNSVSLSMGNGSGGFSSLTSIAVGTSPFSIAIGDFNKDGKQDLVTTNGVSNNASILLGNGLGGFTLFGNASTGNKPYFVVVGDFNNDKNQDLAIANMNSNNISILLGNGQGSFSLPTNISVGASPSSISAGDFNNDGKLDLAVTNSGSNTVSILLGNGTGMFNSNGNVTVGNNPYSIAMQDFNNDGNLDMAVANSGSNTVSIRFGNGLGGFSGSTNLSTGIAGSVTYFVAIRDFNGDGIADIVATNLTLAFFLIGDGSGNFNLNSTVLTGATGVSMIASGEFNGDHRADLALAILNTNKVSILFGLGSEVDIKANNISIPDGSTSISSTINTDFGSVSSCGLSSSSIFSIINTGSATLTINNISSSGINATEFSISGISLPLTLAPNQSVSFTVTLTPSSAGIKIGTIHISNSDCDESDYDFAVQGNALPNIPPVFTSCPGNINITAANGFCRSTANYSVSSTDSSNYTYSFTGATVGSGAGTGSGLIFYAGITHVTITVTNLCGSSNCNFDITVNANTDDNNACTIDECNTLTGIISYSQINISDGNACTLDFCNSTDGTISHQPVITDDNNPCTIDGCNSSTGIFHTYINADDGDACTLDVCNSTDGTISHQPVNSDDNNICTVDGCDSSTGIFHSPINSDDGNVCTVDGCNSITGLFHNSIQTQIDTGSCESFILPWDGTVTTSGDYSHTYLTTSGCDSTVTLHLTIHSKPSATASSNSPVNVGGTLSLAASGGSFYQWNGANNFTSNQQNPSIANVSIAYAGTYTVIVTNSFGCTASASTTVNVQLNSTPDTSSNCYIKNITYVDCRTIQFDIWLEYTGNVPQKFQFFQGGINFNYAGLANGGTITGAFVSGSADPSLPSVQRSLNWNVNQTSKQIRMISSIASPSSIAVQVPSPPGFRIGTFRMKNTSADFSSGAPLNFTFNFITGTSSTTQTKVGYYLNGNALGTDATSAAHFIVGNNQVFSCACLSINVDQQTKPTCFGLSNGSARITLIGSGSASSGTYILDGSSPIPFSTNPFIISGLSAGVHTINATTSCTSDQIQFTINDGDPVDDNNICTVDVCNSTTGVTHTLINVTDGNACTTDGCNSSTGIFHTNINFDDGNVCTSDGCDSSTGIFHTNINIDDGNACTNDACNSLTGIFHTNINIDDGNACTTDGCNSSTGVFHNAVITDDGNVCTADGCNSLTGIFHNPVITDDGNACTTDGCISSTGIFHNIINVDDGNACTIDGCNTLSGPSHVSINVSDLNPCTDDFCDSQTGIISHSPINVDDGNPCTIDACNSDTITITIISEGDGNPAHDNFPYTWSSITSTTTYTQVFLPVTGFPAGFGITDFEFDLNMAHTWATDISMYLRTPISPPLSDIDVGLLNPTGVAKVELGQTPGGFIPTAPYHWSNTGTAMVNTGPAISPGNLYPVIPPTQIQHSSTPMSFSVFNGRNPNGNWRLFFIDPYNQDGGTFEHAKLKITAAPLTAITHTIIIEDDGNACTVDGCSSITGNSYHDPVITDDGNICTIDGCDSLTGVIHNAVNTDDGNACTTDGCNSATGIFHNPTNIDDANVCTTDGCNSSTGVFHNAVITDDGNACTTDGCNSATGIFHNPTNIDDGNACTTDGCNSSTGVFHNAVITDDGNACTTDGCNSATGIFHNPINIDDGNACTTDGCNSLTGVFHNAVNTDDGNACTTDGCNSSTGVFHLNINADDGNACTTDGCNSTTGVFHNPINTDDGNACTTDGCNSSTGEFHNAVNTDDGNSCTLDGCDSVTGTISHVFSNINVSINSSVCGDSFILPWGDIANASGNYSHTYSTLFGCDSVVTIHLTLNASAVATAGNNGPVIAGNQIILSSSGGVNYLWTGPAGFSSILQNPVINSSMASGGIYIVVVTNSNGCTASASTLVVVRTNQIDTYNCYLKNINYTDCKHLEFEIWLEWTGSTPQKFQFFQAGINFNYSGMSNGGIITGSLVTGSPDPSLPLAQQGPNWNINQTSKQIRMLAAIATPSSSATPVPGTPGFRLGKFRMTNTVNFTQGSAPNFTWNYITGTPTTTQIKIGVYLNGAATGTEVTSTARQIIEGNPAMNFNCSGTCPITISQQQNNPPTCLNGNNGNVTISVSEGINTSSGTYTLDGGPPISFFTNPFTVNALASGQHIISVFTNTPCTSNLLTFTTGAGADPEDQNACTSDGCNTSAGIFHNTINFDDGNVCTTDGCNSSTGVFHNPINTDDGDICTTDACNSISGIFHTLISVDDNNVCTADACNSITGVSHTLISVDDNNVCTDDACNSITGISHTSINIDDNNVCTTDACNSISGVSHILISVDDNDVCTNDACNSITGISHVLINVDDNNICTDDACNSITGISHALINVDDNNVCTTDACNSISGASHILISVDDNNVCTNDACNSITGISHTAINIDDNNLCTTDACDPVTGITHTAVNVDDNNVCTFDACNSVTGVSHTLLIVSDKNECTIDGCDSVDGIYHNPINVDDNNACTTDACDIVSGTITHTNLNIDDQNNCTVDFCDPATGIITHTDAKPLILISSDPILCYGGTTCISVNATGGFPPYSGTGIFCGYSMGTYTFEISDSKGCMVSSPPIVISEPLKLIVTTSTTPSVGANGTATAIVTDGTPPYNYLWTPGGQTTSVATNLVAGTYNLLVTDANGCTTTATAIVESSCYLTAPGSISGPAGACKKQTGIVYCVTVPNPSAASYEWMLPDGVTATSASNGVCITLKFTSKFRGGFICAKAITLCGTTASACINVVLLNKKPNTPGKISGPVSLCPNQTATYSIAQVTNATSYLWKVDGHLSIISGQGTASVIVKAASDFTNGHVKVEAINCFDHSGTKTLNLSKDLNCRISIKSIATFKNNSDLFSVYPNPTSGKISISYNSNSNVRLSVKLSDLLGNVLIKDLFMVKEGGNLKELDLSNFPKGIYLISLDGEKADPKILRIIIE